MTGVSICICTRDRPNELSKTLASISQSSLPPHQIIVSDDSVAGDTRQLVADLFPDVVYVQGPKVGLGANRNHVVSQATGERLLLLDDDCLLCATYLEQSQALAALLEDRHQRRVIVTGGEIKNGTFVPPASTTFLGHQRQPCQPQSWCVALAMNSALFPRDVFNRARFDERLVYGYDEVDFAVKVTQQGAYIWYEPSLRNFHYPSERNRTLYATHTEASRLYVTYKRYRYVEHRRPRAYGFALMAPPHAIVSRALRQGAPGLVDGVRAVARAVAHTRSYHRTRSDLLVGPEPSEMRP